MINSILKKIYNLISRTGTFMSSKIKIDKLTSIQAKGCFLKLITINNTLWQSKMLLIINFIKI